MRTKPFAITTTSLAATLGMVLYNPLAGSSGCSADRGSNVIQKIGDGGSGEKSPAKATAAKEDSKTDSNTDETQDTTTDAAEAQPNANSNSSTTPQAGLNKTGSSKSSEPKGNDSQPAQPKKKWGPEQSHRGTEHSQVWVPNIVYTRHERCICTACGAVFDSKTSFYTHSGTMWTQGQGHGGYVDDPYTTTEDQGHYEKQATGQYRVITLPGIGSGHLGLSPQHLIISHSTQRTQRTTYSQGHAQPQR